MKREKLPALAGHFTDPPTSALIPPVHPSTTFVREEHYSLIQQSFSYGRDTNPTYESVERVLGELEIGAQALGASTRSLRRADQPLSYFVREHGRYVR